MSDLESMTQESAVVLGIVAQMSALPEYHDLARGMLSRLANRSSNILVGKPDWKKAGRPPRYTRESLIAALTAAGGNTRVAAGNLGITYKSLRNTFHDHGVVITEVQKAIAAPVVEQPLPAAIVEPRPGASVKGRRPESEVLYWTKARRVELIDLWNRRPMLSIEEIGEKTGCTGQRHPDSGQPLRAAGRLANDGPRGVVEIATPPAGGRRACISCSKPFWSEGKHNRLRAKCNSDDGLSAAEVA